MKSAIIHAEESGIGWSLSMKDLTGKEFGRLTVIRKSTIQKNGRISWHCLCECGNYCDTESKNLLYGGTKSCGCLARESAKRVARQLSITKQAKSEQELTEIKSKTLETYRDSYYVDGIDTNALTRKIRSDNKSGVKGVSYDKQRNQWKVEITLNKKIKFIGRFDSLEDAKEARKSAESIYHEPLLRKLNKEKK